MLKAYSRRHSGPYQKAVLDKIRGLIPMFCLIMGITSGVIQARGIDPERLNAIETALLQNLANNRGFSEIFTGNVIKNGGYMLVIWLTAFIPLGYLAAGFVLFIRAMGYGFTAIAVLSVSDKTGLSYTVNLCVQSIILIAAAYLLCVYANDFWDFFRNKRVSIGKRQILAYFIVLMTAETSVILASML